MKQWEDPSRLCPDEHPPVLLGQVGMGEALGGHGKLRKWYMWFCFCHTDLVIKRLQVEMQSGNASRNAVEKVALYCPRSKGKRKVRNGALADRCSGTAEPCPAVSEFSALRVLHPGCCDWVCCEPLRQVTNFQGHESAQREKETRNPFISQQPILSFFPPFT